MAQCEVCKNDYDKTFEVVMNGDTHIFDSFECAIYALAPTCESCGITVIGHGVEAYGSIYCSANCAEREGVTALKDRVRDGTQPLHGKTVAILVENGFEQEELTRPRRALQENGAATEIISPAWETVKAWDHVNWGDDFQVDVRLENANPDDYDALLLPGGVLNPDSLRRNEHAQEFVRHFFANGKVIAAICHAPWTLIDTGLAVGRRLTSYPSLRTDLENAGATWVDEAVVVDDGLITSRDPDDIPAFNRRFIKQLAGAQPEVVV